MKQPISLPQVDTALDSLAGLIYFSNLNLDSDYWQMELETGDKKRQHSQPPREILSSNLCP